MGGWHTYRDPALMSRPRPPKYVPLEEQIPRNRMIYFLWLRGMKLETLSDRYKISVERVRQIAVREAVKEERERLYLLDYIRELEQRLAMHENPFATGKSVVR